MRNLTTAMMTKFNELTYEGVHNSFWISVGMIYAIPLIEKSMDSLTLNNAEDVTVSS